MGFRNYRVTTWRTVLVALVVVVGSARADPAALPGWSRYDRLCLPCHGRAGDGRGPAAPYARTPPRDFTTGTFAWRTTAWGEPARDDDLRATIARGIPGTSMPAFGDVLAPAQLDELVAIVRAFGPPARPARAVTIPPPPTVTDPARALALWSSRGCAACHGIDGRGDPAQQTYDLSRAPLRHPGAGGAPRATAALAIATGMSGTAMPGYADLLAPDELWALADRVAELQRTAVDPPRALADATIARDRGAPIANGRWPGAGDPDAAIWGAAIAPQGPPPAALTPVEASASAHQCARCHAEQYRAWRASRHHLAASAGFRAQAFALTEAARASCRKCHAPLAEQAEPGELQAQGVTCGGCHLRAWTRNGPPNPNPARIPIATYPAAPRPIYERSDFCLACHQLAPRTAVAGSPLLDTYREWLESPYQPRGVQCQHCHMSDREHAWKGVHDAHAVTEAIALTLAPYRTPAGAVVAVVELRNVGAGHDLPTTATPALWLVVELLDARGAAIAGARADHRIGRAIEATDDGWRELADTRVPPGGRAAIAPVWSGPAVARATAVRLRVVVSPDDYYLHLYERRLAEPLPAERRALYADALAAARADVFTAQELVRPLR